MRDDVTDAGFRIWMRNMAAEKAELLRQRPQQAKALGTIRQWRRGLIEAYRADFHGYPSIEAEVRKIARHAWRNRLGKSIMDPDIVNPDR